MDASRFFVSAATTILLAASTATVATPPCAPLPPGSDAIVFDRSTFNTDGTLRSSALFITDPTGTRIHALTPMIDGIHNVGPASWSPHGSRVAFARGKAADSVGDRYDVYTVKRSGTLLQKLTTGIGNFHSPSWGPDTRIAFVSEYPDHQCLSIVDATGQNQRDLFCPPRPASVLPPQWSPDGRSLYIATGFYRGGLEPLWYSQAYRVDARTGAAQLLTEQVMEEYRHLEFAPTGTRGIYSDPYSTEMTAVDFASDRLRALPSGYSPRFSSDGRRIVFTQDVFGGPPDFLYYQPLFVMDADGRSVRRITTAQVDNLEYTVVDWSRDGRRVLVNRKIYLDPALTISRNALRIIDLQTRAVTRLPEGYAGTGAWFEREGL